MKILRPITLLSALLLGACVTINIYFPAAQAEQAAEKIIDDILGQPKGQPQPSPEQKPADDKGAALERHHLARFAVTLLELAVPTAEAAEPDFEIDTPEIRQLQARMKERNPSLAPFYANGAVGFAGNGLLAIHDAGPVSLRDRARMQALLDAENGDRNALYKAIANANGHPEWEGQVRAVFARKWVERAAAGWWYQDAGGAWVRK